MIMKIEGGVGDKGEENAILLPSELRSLNEVL